MNRTLTVAASILFVVTAGAWAQTAPPQAKSSVPPAKVGVIHIEGAIGSSQQGQKASADLQARYEPKRKDLESRQKALEAKRQSLTKGGSTMSEDAKQKLIQDIDQGTKLLSRDMDDASTDFQQDTERILQELYPRMRAILDKYAKDSGYTLILDIGSPQTPVVYNDDAIDITTDIIALYDKANPVVGASAAPAKPAAPPAKPPAVDPAKK